MPPARKLDSKTNVDSSSDGRAFVHTYVRTRMCVSMFVCSWATRIENVLLGSSKLYGEVCEWNQEKYIEEGEEG